MKKVTALKTVLDTTKLFCNRALLKISWNRNDRDIQIRSQKLDYLKSVGQCKGQPACTLPGLTYKCVAFKGMLAHGTLSGFWCILKIISVLYVNEKLKKNKIECKLNLEFTLFKQRVFLF